MAPGRDCFQALPDALVCRILSEVGALHQMAPCRLVCKRWQSLFTGVDKLEFDCDYLMTRTKPENTSTAVSAVNSSAASARIALLESLIGRTIGASTVGIRDLHIAGPEFGPGAVSLWLRAVSCAVEILTLEEDGDDFVPLATKLVDIFRCPHLEELTLSYYHMDRAPEGVPLLTKLQSLTLNDVAVTDSALEDILALCPTLSYIGLFDCSGLSSPYVSHAALTEVVLSFHEPLPLFTLATKCLTKAGSNPEQKPKLERLSLKYVSKVVVKAPELGKLHVKSPCELLLNRLGTLGSLVLDSKEGSKWMLKEILTAVSGLSKTEVKSVHIPANIRRFQKVVAPSFFGCLNNCADLEIGADLFECIRKCLDGELPQLPLKKVTIHVASVDDRSLEVLNTLVSCCNKLEKLSITVIGSDDPNVWKFTDGLLKLQRSMKQVEISCSHEAEGKMEEDSEEKEEEEDDEDDENEDEDEDD